MNFSHQGAVGLDETGTPGYSGLNESARKGATFGVGRQKTKLHYHPPMGSCCSPALRQRTSALSAEAAQTRAHHITEMIDQRRIALTLRVTYFCLSRESAISPG